jgi:hypothetical protein
MYEKFDESIVAQMIMVSGIGIARETGRILHMRRIRMHIGNNAFGMERFSERVGDRIKLPDRSRIEHEGRADEKKPFFYVNKHAAGKRGAHAMDSCIQTVFIDVGGGKMRNKVCYA